MKRIGTLALSVLIGAGFLMVSAGASFAQEDECVPASHATLVPIIRAPADYPFDAHAQGIEGFVLVTFDVTTFGAVENLRIVESEPRGAFEHGVIQAVMGWRYEPPTDYYGNVVRACGKRQRFAYTLDEE